jgi:hypothetical protein
MIWPNLPSLVPYLEIQSLDVLSGLDSVGIFAETSIANALIDDPRVRGQI